MEFADDIALGDSAAFEIDAFSPRDSAEDRGAPSRASVRAVSASLTLSAGLHIALAAAAFYLLTGEVENGEPPSTATLRVEFFPSNPLAGPALVPEPEAQAVSETAAIDEQPRVAPPEQPRVEAANPDIAGPVDGPVSPGTDSLLEDRTLLSIPSADSVRSAIVSLRSAESSPWQSSDCNRLEREKLFSDCETESGRGYDAATQNPVYGFFNPGFEFSRSRQSVSVLAANSERVASGLAVGSLPAGVSDYVLEEMEQGIETYSNPSSRTLNHMDSMIDKSAAGAMARRLFDPWVLQQSRELQARRVRQR